VLRFPDTEARKKQSVSEQIIVKQTWSHPRIIERLIALRGEGLPIPEIAKKLSEEFDVRITRRAVTHKLYKFKLPRRDLTPSFNIALHGPLDRGSLANLHAAIGDWLDSNGRPSELAQQPKRKQTRKVVAQMEGAER
jgi:hypothetical protein